MPARAARSGFLWASLCRAECEQTVTRKWILKERTCWLDQQREEAVDTCGSCDEEGPVVIVVVRRGEAGVRNPDV